MSVTVGAENFSHRRVLMVRAAGTSVGGGEFETVNAALAECRAAAAGGPSASPT